MEGYRSKINDLIKNRSVDGLVQLLRSLIAAEGGNTPDSAHTVSSIVRQACNYLTENKERIGYEGMEAIGRFLLDTLQAKLEMLSESASYIISLYCNSLESQGKLEEAAKVRSSQQVYDVMSSLPNVFTPHIRVQWEIDTAQCLIKANTEQKVSKSQLPVKAQRVLQRASSLIPECKDDQNLVTTFNKLYAPFLEQCGRTMEASTRYMEIAHSPVLNELDYAERRAFVHKAVVCALISHHSTTRANLLSRVLDDAYFKESSLRDYVNCVVSGRIISRSQFNCLRDAVIERAMQYQTISANTSVPIELQWREHNVMALSRIYLNIPLWRLAVILDCTEEEAERLTVGLIVDSRLEASIDQVNSLVEFGQSKRESEQLAERISITYSELTYICEEIVSTYPSRLEEC